MSVFALIVIVFSILLAIPAGPYHEKDLPDFVEGLVAASTSEECTIPGVTCLALYSHLFMYKFPRILNLSTFSFLNLTENT